MILAWGICVAASFMGWGFLLARLLSLTNFRVALAGPLGICFLATVGGGLNLAHLVTVPVLRTLVLSGVVLCLVDLFTHRPPFQAVLTVATTARRRPAVALLGFLLFTGIALLAFANAPRQYFSGDDIQFYLAYPLKMLLAGTLPFDPFSGSRTMSTLGGNYFLQSLMSPTSDIRSVAFLDDGIGYFFLPVISYAAGKAARLSRPQALALAALATALPFLRVNVNLSVVPACLLLAIAVLMLTADGWRLALLLGSLGGTISLLKSTYLPGVALILAVYCLAVAGRSWADRGYDLLLTGLSAMVVMGPWMFDAKQKTGTYLYPVLGSGYAHEIFVRPVFVYIAEATLPLFLPLVILALLIYLGAKDCTGRLKTSVLAFTLGTAVSLALVGYATRGESVGRYNLPFVNVATILAVALLLTRFGIGRRNIWLRYADLLAVCWALFLVGYYGFVQSRGDYRQDLAAIRMSLSLDTRIPESAISMNDSALADYRRVASRYQDTVPAGETILSLDAAPFALDFARNRIYIADAAGVSSLPPGMPINNPGKLRQYLLGLHIYFVMYASDTNAQEYLTEASHTDPGRRARVFAQGITKETTINSFDKLSHSVRVLFDDGHTRVLDLRG
jgi:hypothetical protein